jgi:hypothetical protein
MSTDLVNEHDVEVRMMAKALDAARDEELRQLRECVRPNYGWDDEPERRREQAARLLTLSAHGDAVLKKLDEMLQGYSAAERTRGEEISLALEEEHDRKEREKLASLGHG